mmetsp:Transcript_71349/g.200086  ORF Transcript_71349/g.200086 Transcript_71349/m.200086 type:complete len:105 (-) Transcript_71349:546-860(-)
MFRISPHCRRVEQSPTAWGRYASTVPPRAPPPSIETTDAATYSGFRVAVLELQPGWAASQDTAPSLQALLEPRQRAEEARQQRVCLWLAALRPSDLPPMPVKAA